MTIKRYLWFALFSAALLASCQSSTAGPKAWIDQPLDGSQFQIEPITVTAHAADSDGVSSLEFSLDGERMMAVDAGGKRLGEASWEWIPAEPGVYTISVVAVDSQGVRGPAAQTSITIGGGLAVPVQDGLQASIEAIECLEGLTVGVTYKISSPAGIESYQIWNTVIVVAYGESFQVPLPTDISQTVQITEPVQDDVDRDHQWGLKVFIPGQTDPTYFYTLEPNNRCPDHYKAVVAEEGPAVVVPGRAEARQNTACRQGPDGLFAVSGYLLQGESAQTLGRLADGSWVQVEMPETLYICWIAANQLIIDPDIVAALPAVVPPPLPVTIVTDTPEPDTSAPVISGLNSNPALILTQSGGCPTYSRTTTVQALISDNVYVQQATANWSVGGESGQISLTRTGGDNFEGVIGPVNTIGNLNITVQARDGAGNTSSASAPAVTVQNCIE